MTPDQVVDLLTTCAAFDRRTVGEADVIAWQAAVGDLDFADARDAIIQHYRNSRDFVMPSDVRKLVKSIREARLAREVTPTPPPELADQPGRYQAALMQSVNRIAAGFAMPKAITGAVADPNAEYLAVRGEDPARRELRTAAMTVRCPRCGVLAAERCVNALDRPLATEPAHDARLVAAGLAEWVDADQQRARLITREAS